MAYLILFIAVDRSCRIHLGLCAGKHLASPSADLRIEPDGEFFQRARVEILCCKAAGVRHGAMDAYRP